MEMLKKKEKNSTKRKVKGFIIIGIIIVGMAFMFITLNNDDITKTINGTFIASVKNDNLSVKEVIEEFHDRGSSKLDGITASIDSKKLMLIDEKNDDEYSINLPSDLFYVAIAPYINDTHPCATHNLVSCVGELQNETFKIKIIDDEGETIVNDNYTTLQNGFIELWLPRNIEGEITISGMDKEVVSSIKTYNESDTCLTTMQLK